MDESTGSNQAEEVVEVQSTESTVADTVTTQEEAPTGIKIKYNGADEVVSYDEAPTWIQKGKNYDKVQEKATQLESQVKYLEKQAKIYGYNTVDEYTKALDAHLAQQEMEQEAARQGIDPEIYAQHLQPLSQEVQDLRQKLQSYEQTEQQKAVQQSWGDLYSAYPNLVESSTAFNEGKNPDWFTPQMQELVGMGYKPVHAYELAHKDTLFKQKEQEVLARVTGRDGKQVLPSVDSPNNMQLDPANMTKAQIDDISARVRRGERIIL